MKILITAGATWVKIDDVRILTNKFTGNTGLFLAKELSKKRHKVTLLVNPHCIADRDLSCSGKSRQMLVRTFRYFDEFKKELNCLLRSSRYDAIVHTAAVSDYSLRPDRGKIPSGKKSITLKLEPTEKIVKTIRKRAPGAVLVQFKLEVTAKDLVEKAHKSLISNNSDIVVANALTQLKSGYRGLLVSRQKKVIAVNSSSQLANNLHEIISLLSLKK